MDHALTSADAAHQKARIGRPRSRKGTLSVALDLGVDTNGQSEANGGLAESTIEAAWSGEESELGDAGWWRKGSCTVERVFRATVDETLNVLWMRTCILSAVPGGTSGRQTTTIHVRVATVGTVQVCWLDPMPPR